jgi:hypothetical protein
MFSADSLLDKLPPPPVIHRHMGQLYRELTLLRRLLRLSQAARDERRELQSRRRTAEQQALSDA